jgi:hypothetical protein
MTISSFLIRLIFLFVPGIIGSILYKKLKGSTKTKDWEDFFEIILFSLVSYGFYALFIELYNLVNINKQAFTFFTALFDEKIPISYKEIFIVSLINIPLAFFASYAYNHKIINKLGQKLRVTKRFGDEDVWDFFHNISDIEWIFVRDHTYNLNYYGWIQAYSDPNKPRELFLRDVKIYDSLTGEFLGELDAVYLSRKNHAITIEVKLSEVFKEDEESSDE